ncbi:MAG: helix-turn-helix domain-containing protein [Clostridia bacterium]|nr:helix-turn-helix domain-containing protein [Clostridia bacterium]
MIEYTNEHPFQSQYIQDYRLIYILSGGAVCPKGRLLKLHDYLLLRPGERIEPECSKNFSAETLRISAEEMELFLAPYGAEWKETLLSADTLLRVSGDFGVQLMLEELIKRHKLFGEDPLFLRIAVNEGLSGILRWLHRRLHTDLIPSEVVKTILEMQKDENLQEGVPAMERLFNLGRAQLCRLIRRYYERTPQEEVVHLRLFRAYELLLTTDLSPETIAERIGYQSLSHFYRIFKQQFGVTPNEIRKN